MSSMSRHACIVAAARLAVTAAALRAQAIAAPPDSDRLIEPATLLAWHEAKARGGPTFSGGPAWRAHMQFVDPAKSPGTRR
jgi:hypothetical protein